MQNFVNSMVHILDSLCWSWLARSSAQWCCAVTCHLPTRDRPFMKVLSCNLPIFYCLVCSLSAIFGQHFEILILKLTKPSDILAFCWVGISYSGIHLSLWFASGTTWFFWPVYLPCLAICSLWLLTTCGSIYGSLNFWASTFFLHEIQSKRETRLSDGIMCPPAPTHIFFLVLACQFTLWNSLSARCIAASSHLG
jgi:hypothetical protein